MSDQSYAERLFSMVEKYGAMIEQYGAMTNQAMTLLAAEPNPSPAFTRAPRQRAANGGAASAPDSAEPSDGGGPPPLIERGKFYSSEVTAKALGLAPKSVYTYYNSGTLRGERDEMGKVVFSGDVILNRLKLSGATNAEQPPSV